MTQTASLTGDCLTINYTEEILNTAVVLHKKTLLQQVDIVIDTIIAFQLKKWPIQCEEDNGISM